MKNKTLPVLGSVQPDPIGSILGTGFQCFRSPLGPEGLAKWTPSRLEILAVHSSLPGRGQFRDFIAAAQRHWPTICIWEVWNPILQDALPRYGFTPETDLQPNGETVSGWRWDKPRPGPRPVHA